MTAGSGILHQEMPKGDAQGRMHGFQLWANLPSSLKMTAPRYQDVAARRHSRSRRRRRHERARDLRRVLGQEGAGRRRRRRSALPRRVGSAGQAQAAGGRDVASCVRLRVRRLRHVPRRVGSAGRADRARSQPRHRADAAHIGNRSLVLFDRGDEVVVQAGDAGHPVPARLRQADRGAGGVVRADRDEHAGGAAAGDAPSCSTARSSDNVALLGDTDPGTPMATETWPRLPLDAWKETYATLHMWTQVVGKIALELTPLTNHFWNVAFHLTPSGTQHAAVEGRRSRLHPGIRFHCPRAGDSDVGRPPRDDSPRAAHGGRVLPPGDGSHGPARHRRPHLDHAGRSAESDPVRDRRHAPIVRSRVCQRLLAHVVAIDPVLQQFRSRFIGKCSPVHFFWGSFDVAVTRFSGRRAPERPEADAITREAYSHEVISHGFWPGSGSLEDAAFYAYAAPEPDGFRQAAIRPAGASYNTEFKDLRVAVRVGAHGVVAGGGADRIPRQHL